MTFPKMVPSGYEVRHAQRDDRAEISELVNRYDVRDGALGDFSEDDLHELWQRPLLDMERDTWVVTQEDGIAGYAMFWHTEPNKFVHGFAVVDPNHFRKGLGAFLAGAMQMRIAEMATEIGQPITLRISAEVTDPPALELLSAQGLEPVRRHYTMLLKLDDATGLETEPSYGIELRTCVPEDARLAHEIFEESFAEHWGHTSDSFEDWSAGITSRDDYDPTLWWIARDGENPAGVLIAQENEGLGWVAILGVLKPWRGRGLGAAMLRTAFSEFKRRGASQVGLGVDAANETGAVALYERVGMHVAKGYQTFERVMVPEVSSS